MNEPTPSPSPAAAAAGSSTASGTADLLADAGPVFDADAIEPAGELPGADDALAGGDVWKEARVRGVLQAKGELLHGAIAVDPDSNEWRYTAGDLSVIAGPLTRILNRYDATRAAAAAGDELTLAVGFAGYAMRSYGERKLALQLLGPEPEPEYVQHVEAIDVRDQAHDVEPDAAAPPVPPLQPRRL